MTTTQPRTNTLRRRPWPHELAEACGADGLSMAQIMQRWRLSTWPAYQSVVDAIEVGAIVRIGPARTTACRYVHSEMPADVIEQREDEIRARMHQRRSRARALPIDADIPVRRTIVPAGSVPPPVTHAPRSVWELGR